MCDAPGAIRPRGPWTLLSWGGAAAPPTPTGPRQWAPSCRVLHLPGHPWLWPHQSPSRESGGSGLTLSPLPINLSPLVSGSRRPGRIEVDDVGPPIMAHHGLGRNPSLGLAVWALHPPTPSTSAALPSWILHVVLRFRHNRPLPTPEGSARVPASFAPGLPSPFWFLFFKLSGPLGLTVASPSSGSGNTYYPFYSFGA